MIVKQNYDSQTSLETYVSWAPQTNSANSLHVSYLRKKTLITL